MDDGVKKNLRKFKYKILRTKFKGKRTEHLPPSDTGDEGSKFCMTRNKRQKRHHYYLLTSFREQDSSSNNVVELDAQSQSQQHRLLREHVVKNKFDFEKDF